MENVQSCVQAFSDCMVVRSAFSETAVLCPGSHTSTAAIQNNIQITDCLVNKNCPGIF